MHSLKISLLLLVLTFSLGLKAEASDCQKLMRGFLLESKSSLLLKEAQNLGYAKEDLDLILESLNYKKEALNLEEAKSYLSFALSLSESEKKNALMDMAQLGEHSEYSPIIKKFRVHEANIQDRFLKRPNMTVAERARYRELFYGCRSFKPNPVNKNAGKDFKRFALTLGLGTVGASYVYFNADKEIDGEWFAKLGFELSVNVLYSYVSGMIQSNPADTQITKSIKSYLLGRATGITDIAIYDPLFNNEKEKAQKRLEEMRKNPIDQAEIKKLLKYYEERGLYRQYKEEIISTLKKLPSGLSLGIKGNSKDGEIDWNNITHQDLDNPVVQEVLVAAAMAQAYQENKGKWIETSDSGIDRYAFNSLFFAAQIPRNMLQAYMTYQILCMGQDRPKAAFLKAVLFNVTANFFLNQMLFHYREEAVGN